MADIKQAAAWLREGKRVRLALWNKSCVGLQADSKELLCLYDERMPNKELQYMPAICDFESNDWEVVRPGGR